MAQNIYDQSEFFAAYSRLGRSLAGLDRAAEWPETSPAWASGADGRRIWPLNQYLVEGPRTTDWLAPGVVKHHRTMGTTLNALIAAGFMITQVEEFCPTPEQIAAQPALSEEVERPMFLLVSAVRGAA